MQKHSKKTWLLLLATLLSVCMGLFLFTACGDGSDDGSSDSSSSSGKENIYLIRFIDDDDSVISSQYYKSGETITVPADPVKPADERYSYTFAGWNKPVSYTAVANETYKATYRTTYIDYRVTFLDDDGSLIAEANYRYGSTVSVPTPKSKADETYTYKFIGWDKEVEKTVTRSATYTAVYDKTYIDYKITLIVNGYSQTVNYHYGDTIVIPSNVSKPNDLTYSYVFKAWTDGVKEYTDALPKVTGAATYTAVFTPVYREYVVVFQSRNGIVYSRTVYHYGDAILVPEDPEMQSTAQYDYEFIGWTDAKGNPVADFSAVGGSVTYYANFEATVRSYTLTIRYEDEKGNELFGAYEQTAEYGTTYAVDSPVKEFYTPSLQRAEGTFGIDGENTEIVVVYSYIYASGNVLEDGFIAISDADYIQNGNIALGGKYRLYADVDLSGFTMSPIGSAEEAFTGVLDGNGYGILNCNVASDSDRLGFFANLSGTVQNLRLEIRMQGEGSGAAYVGGIAAYASGAVVTGCEVALNAELNYQDNLYFGAVIGYALNVRISECSAKLTGSMQGNNTVNGGVLTGYAGMAKNTVTENVFTANGMYAEVRLESRGNLFFGAVSGYANMLTVSRNSAECILTCTTQNTLTLGGIIGQGSTVKADGNHASVSFQGQASAYGANVGGLFGSVTGSVSTSSASIQGKLISYGTRTANVGGFVGNNNGASVSDCFAECDLIVQGEYAIRAGGFVGSDSAPSVQNAYAVGSLQVSCQIASVAGFAGMTGNTKYNACFTAVTLLITADSATASAFACGTRCTRENVYVVAGVSMQVNGAAVEKEAGVNTASASDLSKADFLGWSGDIWKFGSGYPELK